MITPANYRDTVEERSIAKLCGYPICPNKLGKVRPLILHFAANNKHLHVSYVMTESALLFTF